MKKFSILLSCFLLALFVLFELISISVDKGLRMTGNGNYQEWNDIFSKKISPDLIIQGSSRAWVQYNTNIIDSALCTNSYNMGMDGSPFDIQYIRYRACIDHGVVPKVIIQNVDWETISRNTPAYQPYQFLPYLSDKAFSQLVVSQKVLPGSSVCFPFLKYAGEFKAVQIGLLEFCGIHHFCSTKHKGFQGKEEGWDAGGFKLRMKQKTIRNMVDPQVEKLFFMFLDDCRRRGITVYLVYSPPYCKIKSVIDTQSTIDYFQSIATKHKVRFLNLDNSKISFDTLNYSNSTHFNKTGADAFTRELITKIKLYGKK